MRSRADELDSIQRKLRKTILFVTHDVEEALRLAYKIIVMREGKIVQYDTPLGIVTRPADRFVQRLVGSEDILRRLSLIKAGDALAMRARGNGRPVLHSDAAAEPATLSQDDDLRSAISLLLSSATDSLAVVDGDGTIIGHLSIADIRGAAVDQADGIERTRET
jgi:osmoprotectant transport system ATP-binding protein